MPSTREPISRRCKLFSLPMSSRPTRISPEAQLKASGKLWHGRRPLAPHCGRCRGRRASRPGSARPGGSRAADRGRPGRPGPWGKVIDGVPVMTAGACQACFANCRPVRARASRRRGRPGQGSPPRRRLTPAIASRTGSAQTPTGMTAEQPGGRDAVAAKVRQGRVVTSCLTPQAITGDAGDPG